MKFQSGVHGSFLCLRSTAFLLMAGTAILVLGGTGPAGICLLRELLHRGHTTIAYVRNPAKIPDELKSNSLLTVGANHLYPGLGCGQTPFRCHDVLRCVFMLTHRLGG